MAISPELQGAQAETAGPMASTSVAPDQVSIATPETQLVASSVESSPAPSRPTESRVARIIKNVLMNWVAYAVTILTSFFMSPFLVGNLHDSVYGVWVLIGSLAGYLGLLDFGLTPAIVKHIAEYRAKNDQAAINRLISGGLTIFSSLGLLVFAVSFLIALRFNHLFHTPLTDRTAFIVVMIAGLNLALTFPASVFVGALRGYQRYDIDAAITSCTILLQSALIVVLILHGYGILALVGLKFIFDMGRLGFIIYYVRRINPDIRITRGHLDWQEMRRLFSYSSFFFLIMVGNQINFLTDSIVIAAFLSTALVTAYSIANRLVSYLRELVIEMTGVLMPAVSSLDAGEDKSKVQELHILSTKYTLLLSLPLAAVFFILGDVFIERWMGSRYDMTAMSGLLLKVLTVAIIAHLVATPTGSVLTGLGKHQVVARFSIMQALTNLLLSLIFIKFLKGPESRLIGVALGTAASMVIFTLFALPIYIRQYLKVPLAPYLRQSMLLPVLIQPPYIALLLLLRHLAFPSSLWMFFGEIVLSLIPYGIMVFGVGMGQRERTAFLRLLSKSGLKFSKQS
ncbi:MAG: oligosaccharide flippase family protein [Abitibacteriaceae bacterium]|nr:oligosaccharide flippase family protein [Abditibacteriaceae bacterium]